MSFNFDDPIFFPFITTPSHYPWVPSSSSATSYDDPPFSPDVEFQHTAVEGGCEYDVELEVYDFDAPDVQEFLAYLQSNDRRPSMEAVSQSLQAQVHEPASDGVDAQWVPDAVAVDPTVECTILEIPSQGIESEMATPNEKEGLIFEAASLLWQTEMGVSEPARRNADSKGKAKENLKSKKVVDQNSEKENGRRKNFSGHPYKTEALKKPRPGAVIKHIEKLEEKIRQKKQNGQMSSLTEKCEIENCGLEIVSDSDVVQLHLIKYHHLRPGHDQTTAFKVDCPWPDCMSANKHGQLHPKQVSPSCLHRHMAEKHFNCVEKWTCRLCTKNFSRKESLDRHVKTKHSAS